MKRNNFNLTFTAITMLTYLCISFTTNAQMKVESFTGAPTVNEINSFKAYVLAQPPDQGGNLTSRNAWAQFGSGQRTKAMGLMYEMTKDQDILDRMIYYCDVLLSARNDLAPAPVGQHVVWTGRIDPVWPNNGVDPVNTDGEQGDAIGHLGYCARLILETPALWNKNVRIGDSYGYGVTYLARAKRFVKEADYSLDHHVLSDYFTLKNNRMYKNGGTNSVPWNQQMMFTYAFQNLADAHKILNDNAAKVTQYNTIVQACVNWFFSGEPGTAVPYIDSKGNTAYTWAYGPPRGIEDWSHGNLDVQGLYRAYESGNYGITQAQMVPLANVLMDVMRLGPDNYAGRLDGTSASGNSTGTNYIRPGWILTSLFRPADYITIMSEDLTVGKTTGDVTRFSYFLWIKYQRAINPSGSCKSANIIPNTQINGGVWQNTASATLAAGGSLRFGPQPTTGGTWSWIGPNGFTSTARDFTITNIQSNQAGDYTVAFTNECGAVSVQSFKVAVTNLNVSPTVSITSPANNATFTSPATITINANAADVDGSVTKVDFYNGTTLLGSDNSSPYSYTWANVAVGTYTLTAKATDNAGATKSSTAVTAHVVAAVNKAPTVSITSPANNTTFTAPTSITINATAADADGSVTKVDFYNGTTLLGSDNTSPYSFTLANVAVGTYTLTAKATDNVGSMTTSSTITVKVNQSVINACTGVALYVENNGYTDGSKVQNAGSIYQCKPYPYTGWCNGAAWAYAPGTGTYWTDAWDKIGSCTSKVGLTMAMNMPVKSEMFSIVPNPVQEEFSITSEMDLSGGKIQIINTLGIVVSEDIYSGQSLNVASLESGMYTLVFTKEDIQIIKKFIK